jgi:tRNA A-37 threonylcarbamoyl transferase component Bud32
MSTPETSASPLRRIDLVADQFEREHRQGNQPRIATYLDEVPAELRLRLLMELVCIDLEHHLRTGRSLTVADYIHQFPELENLPPEDRADLESHAQRLGDELRQTVDHVTRPTDPSSEDPLRIGRFKIAGRIGSGGQAHAFLSFHPDLKVPIVVKWDRTQEVPDAAHEQRLRQEGEILARLDAHPNLVKVFEFGFHEGRPFLALEHIQGHTLDNYVAAARPSVRQAAAFVAALADAVQTAHLAGIVHLDINPHNVLIDGRGQPRLIDFGLACFQPLRTDPSGQERPICGTLPYLAPEQADPAVGPIDSRTDIFGLGAVLYFLLAGQPLYSGDSDVRLFRRAAQADYDATLLDRKEIPKPLAAICRKALSHEPQARFASAAELATALRAAIHRSRWRGVAALLGLLLAAVLGGWLIGQLTRYASAPEVESSQPSLEVRILRQKTRFASLREALPLKTGDELQMHLHVPAGVHLSLCLINGQGRLSLLQQYPPQAVATELVFPPGPGMDPYIPLIPPEGTELLLVCGRANAPIDEAELQAAWGDTSPWPALDPSSRLLRLQPAQVREEGERPRDFGAAQDRADSVSIRLNGLRERLKPKYPFFEGLVFRHE